MKRKIIWVDLDEVLAEALDVALLENNYKIWSSCNLTKNDIKNHHIYEIFDISRENAIKFYKESLLKDDWIYNIKPVEWAIEKLTIFKNLWYELYVITARDKELRKYSENWLEKYYGNIFKDIYYTEHFSENPLRKSQVCKDLWVIAYIDDDLKHVYDTSWNGIKTYLLEKPWNNWQEISNENIIKVKSWKEIII